MEWTEWVVEQIFSFHNKEKIRKPYKNLIIAQSMTDRQTDKQFKDQTHVIIIFTSDVYLKY